MKHFFARLRPKNESETRTSVIRRLRFHGFGMTVDDERLGRDLAEAICDYHAGPMGLGHLHAPICESGEDLGRDVLAAELDCGLAHEIRLTNVSTESCRNSHDRPRRQAKVALSELLRALWEK